MVKSINLMPSTPQVSLGVTVHTPSVLHRCYEANAVVV
jgi:hypothetical protein